MNPLEIMLKEMNKNGISCEITRKTEHGVLEPVKPQEIETLTTKSRIATTAQLISRLTKEEKLAWAIETKEEGNILYQQQDYINAMQKYVECLTATDFGKKEKEPKQKPQLQSIETEPSNAKEEATTDIGERVEMTEDNIDQLVVPVLSNLSACCMQLQQWSKVVLFTKQILDLRPNNIKATYRQGVALIFTGEFGRAVNQLTFVFKEIEKEKRTSEGDEGGSLLSERDHKNLFYYLRRAKEGLQREKESVLKQKESLQKAFASVPNPNPIKDNQAGAEQSAESTAVPRVNIFVYYLCVVLSYLLPPLLAFLKAIIPTKSKKVKSNAGADQAAARDHLNVNPAIPVTSKKKTS